MTTQKRFVLVLVCLTLSSMLVFNCEAFFGLGKKKVVSTAVFSAPGATIGSCVDATVNVLSAQGFKVKTITTAEIIAPGGLKDVDVILLPGGSGSGEGRALGQDGCAVVEQFVKNGGGYIGTCAGGYLGALGYTISDIDASPSAWLELVNAEAVDIEHWDRGGGEPLVKVTDPMHPILKGFPPTFNAHYANGPLLKPGNDPNLPPYKELAVYVDDICKSGGASPGVMPGTDALVVSEYGKGRCVLFSFHPESTDGLEKMLGQAVLWSVKKLN